MDDNGGIGRWSWVGGYHVREKRLGDWKRVTYNDIEFLLRLISHIHFIILSLLYATVCCRKFVLISVCICGVRFHGVCVYSSVFTVYSELMCIYVPLLCLACAHAY